MKKTYNVDSTYNNMRIDRWVRNYIGNIPQGLIEKNLRKGKIKLNKKKIKSSQKIKTNDQIDFFNFDFKEKIVQKKIKFQPSKEIIKSNEKLGTKYRNFPWSSYRRKIIRRKIQN